MRVMVNGLPGKMARQVVERILRDDKYKLVTGSLTGPEITDEDYITENGTKISLIPPDFKEQIKPWSEIGQAEIMIDYTEPKAVNGNAEFYCQKGYPFIMGTTGGDRELLYKTVEASQIPALISPNMSPQIVAFMAAIQYLAEMFPGVMRGFEMSVVESHQRTKKDTSGTAKEVIKLFNGLGIEFEPDQIQMIREPLQQLESLKIPREFIEGHAWHTYMVKSRDLGVTLGFTHNVNGRATYVDGTIMALDFMYYRVREYQKIMAEVKAPTVGRVYTMVDVIKAIRSF